MAISSISRFTPENQEALEEGKRIKLLCTDPLLRHPFEFSAWVDKNAAILAAGLKNPTSAALFIDDCAALFAHHGMNVQAHYPIFTALGDLQQLPQFVWKPVSDLNRYYQDGGMYYQNESLVAQKQAQGSQTLSYEEAIACFGLLQSADICWEIDERQCVGKARLAMQLVLNLGVNPDSVSLVWCYSDFLKNKWEFHAALAIEDAAGQLWVLDPTISLEGPLTKLQWVQKATNGKENAFQELTVKDLTVKEAGCYLIQTKGADLIKITTKNNLPSFEHRDPAFEKYIYDKLAIGKIERVMIRHPIFRELFHSLLTRPDPDRRRIALTKLAYAGERQYYLITPKDMPLFFKKAEAVHASTPDLPMSSWVQQMEEFFVIEDFVDSLDRYVEDTEQLLPKDFHQTLKKSLEAQKSLLKA